MEIGKVVGNIVSVAKIDELKPVKLFLIQLLEKDYKPSNDYIVAIDLIGLGYGDYVIITQGSGSRFTDVTKPFFAVSFK